MAENTNLRVNPEMLKSQPLLQGDKESVSSKVKAQNLATLAACISPLLAEKEPGSDRSALSSLSGEKGSSSTPPESFPLELQYVNASNAKNPMPALSLLESSATSFVTSSLRAARPVEEEIAPLFALGGVEGLLGSASEFATEIQQAMPELMQVLKEFDKETGATGSNEEKFAARMESIIPGFSDLVTIFEGASSEPMAFDAASTEEITVPDSPPSGLPGGVTSGYNGSDPTIFAFAAVAQQNIFLNGLQQAIAAVEGSSSNVQTQKFNNSMIVNGTNLQTQLNDSVQKAIKQEKAQKRWKWFTNIFRVVDLVVSAIFMPEMLPKKIVFAITRIVNKTTGGPLQKIQKKMTSVITQVFPKISPAAAKALSIVTMGAATVVAGAATGAFGAKGVAWAKSLGSKAEKDVIAAVENPTSVLGRAWAALKSSYTDNPVKAAAVLGMVPGLAQTMVKLSLLAPKGPQKYGAVAGALAASLALAALVGAPATMELINYNMKENLPVTLMKVTQWVKALGLALESAGNAGMSVNFFEQGKIQGNIQLMGASVQRNNELVSFESQSNESYQQSISETIAGAQKEIMTILQAFSKQASKMDFTLQV